MPAPVIILRAWHDFIQFTVENSRLGSLIHIRRDCLFVCLFVCLKLEEAVPRGIADSARRDTASTGRERAYLDPVTLLGGTLSTVLDSVL
jgi:hypothetical protein